MVKFQTCIKYPYLVTYLIPLRKCYYNNYKIKAKTVSKMLVPLKIYLSYHSFLFVSKGNSGRDGRGKGGDFS